MTQYRDLSTIRAAIAGGNLNLPVLVQSYLDRIAATRDLNIYIEVFEQEALERAEMLQRAFEENPEGAGPLFGMVASIKDVLCYAGHRVTAGSRILEGFTSLFSATAVERLLNAGAIIIGRVNCDEFAMGSSNENSCYGPTRNGADPERIPGGSSGASAVSVQMETCLVSLGSDTGGSVRQPAAFCGVVGFKPGYGRISRHGLIAYGSSFDQIGILAHSTGDVATVLGAIAGPDNFDSTALPDYPGTYTNPAPLQSPLRIAFPGTAINHPGLDHEVRQHCNEMIHWLREKGHSVQEVDFEYLDYIIPAYYVLTTAEASSNLARYDGVRYGYRSPDAENLLEVYKKSRTEGFGTEVKRRIILGTFVLSSGYYDAYYSRAQKVRRLICMRTEEIFRDFDAILIPATPAGPWKIGETLDDPVAMYLADIFTVHANMAGIPAIALPTGKHADGLPMGLQFMAAKGNEATLLALGNYLQNNFRQ
jgi:aspartyl-tRNA(Asn)/glutamyl-tRNA(Gln) amidotransferase subunit A